MTLNKKLSLSGFVLLLFVTACMADKKPDQAWWLNLTIKPNLSQLGSIDITKFNKNWTHAVYLDNSLIKNKILDSEFSELETSKFKLTLNTDLNNNKTKETIKVGVYQKDNNKKGIFLAILENSKPIKVFTDSSNEGFSALIEYNNSIRWYKCMNCGEYESIHWNGKSYTLE